MKNSNPRKKYKYTNKPTRIRIFWMGKRPATRQAIEEYLFNPNTKIRTICKKYHIAEHTLYDHKNTLLKKQLIQEE